MHPRKLVVALLCVATVTLCAASAFSQAEGAAEPILLRLKYETGEVLNYETKMEGVGSVHIMGQAQAISMNGDLLITMTVEGVDEEGNYTILTCSDMGEVAVTVAGTPMAPPNQTVQIRTTMSPRGEILTAEVIESANQPDTAGPWNDQLMKMLTGGFDLERMLMGQKIAAFPEEPVKLGDEWTGSAPDIEMQGQTAPVTITTKYGADVEIDGRNCVTLDSTCVVEAAALGEMAATLGMNGTTSTQTRTWFDPEAGRTVASMDQAQVNMQVTLPAAMTGGQAASVFLEMFVNSQTKLLVQE